MIYLYSGTPGSGKSYHAVADIYYRLKKRKGFKKVIANFPLSSDATDFTFMDNEDMTISNFISYAKKNHKFGLEGQTLIVIDEAQIIFNSRSWNSKASDRMDWIKFFSQHRKLGFNFILIAQFDRMIDRQIRCLIEYEIAHMKINNFFALIPLTVFLCVTRWYGQRMKIGHDVMLYRNKIAKFYDTFRMFDNDDTNESWGQEGGGDQGVPSTNCPQDTFISLFIKKLKQKLLIIISRFKKQKSYNYRHSYINRRLKAHSLITSKKLPSSSLGQGCNTPQEKPSLKSENTI